MRDCGLKGKRVTADVMEYLGPVECRMSQGKGRGLFATRDIKKGEFIVVEKPFADSKNCELTDKAMQDLSVLFQIKLTDKTSNKNINLTCDIIKKMRLKKQWMAQAMQNFYGGESGNIEVNDVRLLNDAFCTPE